MMSMYGTHITAKSTNVPAGDSVDSIHGVSCPMRYVPIHSASPAMLMASPRTLLGYISESSTNTTALMLMAQQKT